MSIVSTCKVCQTIIISANNPLGSDFIIQMLCGKKYNNPANIKTLSQSYNIILSLINRDGT